VRAHPPAVACLAQLHLQTSRAPFSRVQVPHYFRKVSPVASQIRVVRVLNVSPRRTSSSTCWSTVAGLHVPVTCLAFDSRAGRGHNELDRARVHAALMYERSARASPCPRYIEESSSCVPLPPPSTISSHSPTTGRRRALETAPSSCAVRTHTSRRRARPRGRAHRPPRRCCSTSGAACWPLRRRGAQPTDGRRA